MTTLVATGANGFIGTHVLEAILHENNCKAVSSDLPESTSRNLHSRFSGTGRVEYVPHTQLEQHVRSLSQKPLAIVHNGACSYTTETNPEVFERLNLSYSKSMWKLCCDLGIPFIYASSAGVYGLGDKGFSDKKSDCHIYEPLSLYAKSKHDFDMWVLQQTKTPPTWFGLRYFNVYGAHEEHKGGQATMVLHAFRQICRTGKVKLFKSTTPEYQDGDQLRDFLYVKDIARITMELIHLSQKRLANPQFLPLDGNGLFLNVGTGTPQSWNKLAHLVFEALGRPPNIEYIDMPESLAKQYQNYTCANLSSWNLLAIKPTFTSFEDGVTDYVKNYLIPTFGTEGR